MQKKIVRIMVGVRNRDSCKEYFKSVLAYADDIVLIGKNETEIRQLFV
jgi:hypothetical protein